MGGGSERTRITDLDADREHAAAQALRIARTKTELTRENWLLLQSRLRRVAGIIFIAIVVFLARDFFLNVSIHNNWLWTLHIFCVVTLAGCYFWLGQNRLLGIGQLVVAELIVFGVPAVLLLFIQRQVMLISAEAGLAHDPVGPWLMLMMSYALFIPTSLHRAVVILGAMALAPLVLIGGGMFLHDSLRTSWSVEELSRIALCMVFGAGVLVYGSITLGTLRSQAVHGKRLGQYWLKELIGAGGMGEVYLAEHQLLKRRCAVKVIPPSRATDPKALARFEREVQTTATLSHANTVEIYDYGRTDEGIFYYVMEYLEGMTLADLVRRYGPLPPGRTIHLLRQICGALHEAHSIGFVHRDVKPANIFASVRGGVYDVVKLLDFGLVKELVPTDDVANTEGNVTGSPMFMSPEQVLGKRTPDARSDIYSLGAVAYFLLAGRPPFEGQSPLKVMAAHLHEQTAPFSEECGVPDDLARIVFRCLAKDPEDRFPTVRELSKALDQCKDAGMWTSEDAEKWWTNLPAIGDDATQSIGDNAATTVTADYPIPTT